jgi:hypothetical protein
MVKERRRLMAWVVIRTRVADAFALGTGQPAGYTRADAAAR